MNKRKFLSTIAKAVPAVALLGTKGIIQSCGSSTDDIIKTEYMDFGPRISDAPTVEMIIDAANRGAAHIVVSFTNDFYVVTGTSPMVRFRDTLRRLRDTAIEMGITFALHPERNIIILRYSVYRQMETAGGGERTAINQLREEFGVRFGFVPDPE